MARPKLERRARIRVAVGTVRGIRQDAVALGTVSGIRQDANETQGPHFLDPPTVPPTCMALAYACSSVAPRLCASRSCSLAAAASRCAAASSAARLAACS